MRHLSRTLGEAAVIDHELEVRMVASSGTVKLGFAFPPEASVLREGVAEAIELANRAAAKAAGALPAAIGMAARVEKPGSGAPDG